MKLAGVRDEDGKIAATFYFEFGKATYFLSYEDFIEAAAATPPPADEQPKKRKARAPRRRVE